LLKQRQVAISRYKTGYRKLGDGLTILGKGFEHEHEHEHEEEVHNDDEDDSD
jgi:hypothetical protein